MTEQKTKYDIINAPKKEAKQKNKAKKWSQLSTNDKLDYLAAQFGIGPDTVLE